MTRLNELTRMPPNDPTERFYMGSGTTETKPQGSTKPTSGHNLAFLIRARLAGRALARTTHQNELTRTPSNDSPEQFYMGARMTEMKP